MIAVVARLGDGAFHLTVTGHEGHVEDGLVCAGISAITQTALLGLQAIAQEHPGLVTIDITEERST